MNTLFDGDRMSLGDSISVTVDSLREYGRRHKHWAIAWSGGKDSTTVLTLTLQLIRAGLVPAPERMTVLYADTGLELPPLAAAAGLILERLIADGVDARVVKSALDKRFLVYILGRGVPPPNNNTLRWCTRQIKIDPLQLILHRIAAGSPGKLLVLTGVRMGESAQRDQRIALSCGRNGGECGQGWYQETLPDSLCDTLAPILHWRTCLVWDWLSPFRRILPTELVHPYPTELIAEAYGLSAEGSVAELGTRTGCTGCPLAAKDTALDNLMREERWSYLAPLLELKPLYRWLREPAQRLRKPGFETSKSGEVRWTNRLGPLTFEARRTALAKVLEIQARCSEGAARAGMPAVALLDSEEHARIEELIALGTWPRGWEGTEPRGDAPFERVHADGSRQLSLPSLLGGEA